MIAALYIEEPPRGIYFGLPGVDPWPHARDARSYPGPYPVVAHPPCARWCRLAGLVEARWGLPRGVDDGCFAAALASVRRWGGGSGAPGLQRRVGRSRLATASTVGMATRALRRVVLLCRAGSLRPSGQEGDVALRVRPRCAPGIALGLRERLEGVRIRMGVLVQQPQPRPNGVSVAEVGEIADASAVSRRAPDDRQVNDVRCRGGSMTRSRPPLGLVLALAIEVAVLALGLAAALAVVEGVW